MESNDLTLLEALKEGVVMVRFNKVDGEERLMSCTLNPMLMPRQQADKTLNDRPKRKRSDEVLSVWDVNRQDWRSFRLENVISAHAIAFGSEAL